MIEQGWGRIVNIGSVVARSPAPGNAIGYVAAKAGLVGMSRQLALEVARTGVTVNVVHPGSIGTEHLDDYFMTAPDGTKQHLMDTIPLGRLGGGHAQLLDHPLSGVGGRRIHNRREHRCKWRRRNGLIDGSISLKTILGPS